MNDVLLVQGNALSIPLKDQSINVVCTSPPYMGLRSYAGVEPSCWPGGTYVPVPGAAPIVIPGPTPEAMAACTHEWLSWEEPRALTLKAEDTARIHKRRKASTRGTTKDQLKHESPFVLTDSSGEPQGSKHIPQTQHELLTSTTNNDTTINPHTTIAINNTSQKGIQKLRGDSGHGERATFTRDDAKSDQPACQVDTPEIPTENLRTRVCNLPIPDRGERRDEIANKERQASLGGDKPNLSIRPDMPISNQQAEHIGKVSCPSMETFEKDRVGITSCLSSVTVKASSSTEGTSDLGTLPINFHEQLTATSAGNFNTFLPDEIVAQPGTSATSLNLGRTTTIDDSTSFTSKLNHTSSICQKCGAIKCCLGNEPTVQRYIFNTLLWLRECWRIMRDDATLWLVCGDSFSSGDRQGHGTRAGHKQQTNRGMNGTADPPRAPQPDGYAQGCLLGIPAQVMLAAAADGWVVRNDVIWSKNSPMPESVTGWRWQQARCSCLRPNRVYSGQQGYATASPRMTVSARHRESSSGTNGLSKAPATLPDPACPQCGGSGVREGEVLRKGSWRHTRSHETILQLTKGMQYWANGEAVREALSETNAQRTTAHYNTATRYGGTNGGNNGLDALAAKMRDGTHSGRNPRSVLCDAPSATGELAALRQWLGQHCPEVLDAYQADQQNPLGVVTPRSANLNLAHYASFPADLLVPLIKATCPERVCPVCGQGWAPSIERTSILPIDYNGKYREAEPQSAGRRILANVRGRRLAGEHHDNPFPAPTVHGLRPTCTHYCTCAPPVATAPCLACGKLSLADYGAGVVFDPFLGSGTTAEVARALGRRAVGLDLSRHYLKDIAKERLGLNALDAWAHGEAAREDCFTDLPLFGGTERKGPLHA